MIRWLIVIVVALVCMSGLSAWLRRLGFGRLPGDFVLRAFGREWPLPIASTIVLSLIASAIAHWV